VTGGDPGLERDDLAAHRLEGRGVAVRTHRGGLAPQGLRVVADGDRRQLVDRGDHRRHGRLVGAGQQRRQAGQLGATTQQARVAQLQDVVGAGSVGVTRPAGLFASHPPRVGVLVDARRQAGPHVVGVGEAAGQVRGLAGVADRVVPHAAQVLGGVAAGRGRQARGRRPR
jgi:hypothetical protein